VARPAVAPCDHLANLASP